jgi:hypothetical protein
LLELEPDVLEGAADELPQAARINGTTPTNMTIRVTGRPRLRLVSWRVAGKPDRGSTRSLPLVAVLLTFLIGPYLEARK